MPSSGNRRPADRYRRARGRRRRSHRPHARADRGRHRAGRPRRLPHRCAGGHRRRRRDLRRARPRSGKPVILAANKCEGRAAEPGLYEAFSLGLGEPLPISAEHDLGIGDLSDAIEEAAAQARGSRGVAEQTGEEEERAAHPLRIAVVGRPNVGKSTLVNTLLGEERMITGPEAGITRDAIAVELELAGQAAQAVRHGGLEAQDADGRQGRGAVGRRHAQGDPLCRSRRAAARRRASLREAGFADRRSHRARRAGRSSSP